MLTLLCKVFIFGMFGHDVAKAIQGYRKRDQDEFWVNLAFAFMWLVCAIMHRADI